MSEQTTPYSIPGWMIDLITDGVRTPKGQTANKRIIIREMRKVMLAAHRLGIDWMYLRSMLCDVDKRVLADQIATGRKGKRMLPVKRTLLLDQHWESTGKVVADSQRLTKDDFVRFVQFVRDNEHLLNALADDKRTVMLAVVTLAEQYQVARPAVPARRLAELTGFSRAKAHRLLIELVNEGIWLRMHERGKSGAGGTRKSNIVHLAPVLWDDWLSTETQVAGKSTCVSLDPPVSHPPVSHSNEEPTAPMKEITVEQAADQIVHLQGSPRALVEFIVALQERDPRLAVQASDLAEQRSRRHLSVVEDASA